MGGFLSQLVYYAVLYCVVPIAFIVAVGAGSDWLTKAREEAKLVTNDNINQNEGGDSGTRDSVKEVFKDALKDIVKGVGGFEYNGDDGPDKKHLGGIEEKSAEERTKKMLEGQDTDGRYFLFDIFKQLVYRCDITDHNYSVFRKLLDSEAENGQLAPFQQELLGRILDERLEAYKAQGNQIADEKGALSFVVLRTWADAKSEENLVKEERRIAAIAESGDAEQFEEVKHSTEKADLDPSPAVSDGKYQEQKKSIDFEDGMRKAEARMRRLIDQNRSPWKVLVNLPPTEEANTNPKHQADLTLVHALDFLEDSKTRHMHHLEQWTWNRRKTKGESNGDHDRTRQIYLESAAVLRSLSKTLRTRIQQRQDLGVQAVTESNQSEASGKNYLSVKDSGALKIQDRYHLGINQRGDDERDQTITGSPIMYSPIINPDDTLQHIYSQHEYPNGNGIETSAREADIRSQPQNFRLEMEDFVSQRRPEHVPDDLASMNSGSNVHEQEYLKSIHGHNTFPQLAMNSNGGGSGDIIG
eukprot:CAMPEP_0114525546 /NCGR_PEP_ID=MMETSP0109-20121206/22492_1 /TAXON_ID=29199 /ORGANISM="Chlorarachnion reptans, Strain CCCM449" /LENGTH=526 /DNA_ID=CAMNT_0001707155 /DNA_START=180 /DNA_END=1760 /DNA_ORIENTATION=+